MGQFSYKAVDKVGSHVDGTIIAADRRSAVATLAERGQFVTELVQEEAEASPSRIQVSELVRLWKFGGRGATSKDILEMTSQLSTALRAGLPLLSALEIIREQQHKTAIRKTMDDLVRLVSSGQSLSEAMAKHKKAFGPLYLSMIRVGETGGILEKTTTQLSLILTRDEKIKTSMKNAAAYPILVLGLGIVSVIVVITWILPSILATISGDVAALPWPTRALLALSNFIKSYGWLVVILLLIGVYSFRQWINSTGRLKWDSFKLRIPVLGTVLRTIAVGRFARTLGALTKGGVTILESLNVVRDTLGNELLGRQIDAVAEEVKGGSALAPPLKNSGYFPPLLVQIVSVGEQTGSLDELLLNAADTFDDEVDSAINRFVAIFPAILILLLALVIGFIIAATLLPIVMMELSAGGF